MNKNNDFGMMFGGFAVLVRFEENSFTIEAQRQHEYEALDASVRMVDCVAFVVKDKQMIPSDLFLNDHVRWLDAIGLDSIEQKEVDEKFIQQRNEFPESITGGNIAYELDIETQP